MKTILVGGTFSLNEGEPSTIIKLLADELNKENNECYWYNGGTSDNLLDATKMASTWKDLILWFPNISNDIKKNYPQKNKGTVLICSKVMREGYNRYDSCSRIFTMHGNAVIEIYKEETGFRFILVDALANEWVNTMDISILAKAIIEFYNWTKKSIRKNTSKKSIEKQTDILNKLSDLTKQVADKVELKKGSRYFGNVSTRCESMFPTLRFNSNSFYVSARNIDKQRITSDDFVIVTSNNSELYYEGDRKPSVDSPVQIIIYNLRPNINYMIHGHAYVKNTIETECYFPCGDIREIPYIFQAMRLNDSDFGIINLKNHGFLFYSDTIENLEKLICEADFEDTHHEIKGGFNKDIELRQEIKDELDSLSIEQRVIVLKGLNGKLGFYNKTKELSYKYSVCPICIDIGSTEKDPKCEKCYLKIGCKEPFTQGFRYDQTKGYQYFTAMKDYLENK